MHRRQVGQRDRRRVEAACGPAHCTGEARSANTGSVIQKLAAQLEQQGRMPEPEQAAVRRRLSCGAGQRRDRQRRPRHGVVGLVEQEVPQDAHGLGHALGGPGRGIAEAALGRLRRVGVGGDGPVGGGERQQAGAHGQDSEGQGEASQATEVGGGRGVGASVRVI